MEKKRQSFFGFDFSLNPLESARRFSLFSVPVTVDNSGSCAKSYPSVSKPIPCNEDFCREFDTQKCQIEDLKSENKRSKISVHLREALLGLFCSAFIVCTVLTFCSSAGVRTDEIPLISLQRDAFETLKLLQAFPRVVLWSKSHSHAEVLRKHAEEYLTSAKSIGLIYPLQSYDPNQAPVIAQLISDAPMLDQLILHLSRMRDVGLLAQFLDALYSALGSNSSENVRVCVSMG